jgi:ABC-type branched-subunit amino acid transport system substrate-binding protein
VTFNRAFADAGLDRHILRLSAASEENTLLGIGAENAGNLFFAAGYLAGLETDANRAFLDRYHGAFGKEAPVPNTIGESCYEGVRFYAELARRAGALDVETLGRASQGLCYVGARGRSRMLARHLQTDIYLAQADGLDFRVVQHFPV